MPLFPDFSARQKALKGSVFEKYLPLMRQQGDNLVRLHIGDAYRQPPYPLPIEKTFREAHPLFNRYCNTFGIPTLRGALSEKLSTDNALDFNEEEILLTAGAANALVVCTLGLLDPGERVMILTPCWPFFPGMVRMAEGEGYETPFYQRLYDQPDLDIAAYLDHHLQPGTVALYLNTPNNPSGKVLSRTQLEQVAGWAAKHNLWVLSDEAYDGMTYDDHQHISIATLPGMRERTLSIFTFSKVYMFAGIRLGYIAAAEPAIRALNKILVHLLYGPSTIGQQMVVEAVQTRRSWYGDFVRECQGIRDDCLNRLDLNLQSPEGAYYLFFSTEPYLRGRGYDELIRTCLEGGVSVAPGVDFGSDFRHHMRVCFAGEPPERMALAMARLGKILKG